MGFAEEQLKGTSTYMILVSVYNGLETSTDIAREWGVTYSHINGKVMVLEEEGLIERVDEGTRKKPIRLTEEGEKVAEHLYKAGEVLSDAT